MDGLRVVATHVAWPLVEPMVHGLTPLTMLNALVLSTLALLTAHGAEVFGASGAAVPRPMSDVLTLWAMASMTTLLWLLCVLALRSEGLA